MRSNGYGRDEQGVAADERSIANHCSVFLLTIVIAGNGARADIGASTHVRVSDI
jgi:hypothetical protein